MSATGASTLVDDPNCARHAVHRRNLAVTGKLVMALVPARVHPLAISSPKRALFDALAVTGFEWFEGSVPVSQAGAGEGFPTGWMQRLAPTCIRSDSRCAARTDVSVKRGAGARRSAPQIHQLHGERHVAARNDREQPSHRVLQTLPCATLGKVRVLTALPQGLPYIVNTGQDFLPREERGGLHGSGCLHSLRVRRDSFCEFVEGLP